MDKSNDQVCVDKEDDSTINLCDRLWDKENIDMRIINPSYVHTFHVYKKLIKDIKGDVLDFGCGGNIDKIRLVSDRTNYVGVDISENVVEKLRRNNIRSELVGLDCKTNFKDDSFDYVISIDVIEHIEDDSVHLREIRRVLRNGGKLILCTVMQNYLWSKLDEESMHFRRYSEKELRNKLSKFGFRIKKKYYTGTCFNYILHLYRKLRSKDDYYKPKMDHKLTKALRLFNVLVRFDNVFNHFGIWGFGIHLECELIK